MNQIEDLLLLKRCFCEFITKLLPTIRDPAILTRTRWHQFRNILLDEYKSTQEIYNYVKDLQFSEGIQIKTPQTNNSPQKQQVSIEQKDIQLNLAQQAQKQDVFVKQPSKRKLSMKKKDDKLPDTTAYRPLDEVQKVNYYTGKVETYQNLYNQRKSKIDKEKLISGVKDLINIFKKDTTTLGTVYNKSFEINTSELEPTHQNSIQASNQAQMDLQYLQNAQRNATLKGYSVYAKKDKEGAKQRVEEYAQNYQNQRKVYV